MNPDVTYGLVDSDVSGKVLPLQQIYRWPLNNTRFKGADLCTVENQNIAYGQLSMPDRDSSVVVDLHLAILWCYIIYYWEVSTHKWTHVVQTYVVQGPTA